MDTITVVYSGGFPELITENGIRILRGKPVALPRAMAEAFLRERPEEFEKVED
jgi:hypothetical protein